MVRVIVDEEIILNKNKKSDALVFFNSLRVIAMIFVILFHAVGSYSIASLYWGVQDPTKDIFSNFIRYFFDIFIMPLFFFIAGYFGIKSLQKYSLKKFVYSKYKRLMIYWIVINLVFLPFFLDKFLGLSKSYSNYFIYWVNYISSIGTVSINPLGATFNHIHFWFLSLLFYFFIILIIIYYFTNKRYKNAQGNDMIFTKKSMFRTIMIFGTLISFGTFILLLISSEKNWLIINFIIQFKISGILTFIGLFGLGAYASTKKWFTDGKVLGGMKGWGIASMVLIMLFFIIGTQILTEENSQLLNPGILLTFAFIRSFLCISIIFFLLSLTMKYMNKPSFFNTELAENSFNIYIVHVFIVIAFQMVLLNWVGPPIINIAKIMIITFASLIISFIISKYIFKKVPRKVGISLITIVLFILPILATFFPFLNAI